MTTVSVIMPVYNVEDYVAEAIESVLQQSFTDFELIVVDDGSSDQSIGICERFNDSRIKIVSQKNRGLPGARNTGIWHSTGRFVALLDSDDLWSRDKLQQHVAHLEANPAVGVSYSQSDLIDAQGERLGVIQKPKLQDVTVSDIFCRNPIGNGSAPVIRREVFEQIAFNSESQGKDRQCYFDEEFRYSEDIECWMRIALTTNWLFEGIGQPLTQYRIVAGGLSANTEMMMEYWNKMYAKVQKIAPQFAVDHGDRAYAYQRRYYARRAVIECNGENAWSYMQSALKRHPKMFIEEPVKTLVSFIAAGTLRMLPFDFRSILQSLNRAFRQDPQTENQN